MKSRTVLVAILLLTLLVYWPVVHARFTNWDDDVHLTNNPLFDPPMASGLGRFWESGFAGLYIPLTYSIWMVIGYLTMRSQPHGADKYLRPSAFHSANLVAHLLAVAAVFLALKRLLRQESEEANSDQDRRTSISAAAGALLFALHPMQVDTVAWVSGFRDGLAGCFCAIAFWQYVAYVQASGREQNGSGGSNGGGAGNFIAMFLASGAAMLSKPNAAALPLLLLAVHLCWMRRSLKSAVAALLPVVALAVPCLVANQLSQAHERGPLGSALLRPIVALDALGFYLSKLFVPIGLVPDYGRYPLHILRGPAIWTVSLALLSGAGLAWWIARKGVWRAGAPATSLAGRVMAGVVVAVAGLSPVLGLVPFDFQVLSTVADHYMYVPMIGIAMAAAAVVDAGLRRRQGSERLVVAAGACAVVAMILLTRNQIAYWHNSSSIWRHELRVNPDSWTGQNNAGCVLMDNDDFVGAEPYFRRAIALYGDDLPAQLNLGQSLANQSRFPEALAVYRAAVRKWPDMSETHEGLANVLFNMHDLHAALVEYDRAIHAKVKAPYSKSPAQYERVKEMLRAAASSRSATGPASGPAPAPAAAQPQANSP
jgi:tetratricopeptide (TPR) repeat protein